MTLEQKQKLKREWLLTCAYYGKEVRDDVLNMVIHDFEEQDFELVMRGIQLYRKNPDHKFAPLPAQIIQVINPEDSVRPIDKANMIASRLWAGIASIGSYAKREVVERKFNKQELEVIDYMGGWQNVSRGVAEDEKGVWIAQTRDMAMAVVNSSGTRRRREELLPVFATDMIESMVKNIGAPMEKK